jgi:TPP-dependent pyruvate/acetoin dehydrogenase alpha subunit
VDVDALRAEVTAEIEAAATEALAGPMPTADDVMDGVFATGEAEPLSDGRAPWTGYAKAAAGDDA